MPINEGDAHTTKGIIGDAESRTAKGWRILSIIAGILVTSDGIFNVEWEGSAVRISDGIFPLENLQTNRIDSSVFNVENLKELEEIRTTFNVETLLEAGIISSFINFENLKSLRSDSEANLDSLTRTQGDDTQINIENLLSIKPRINSVNIQNLSTVNINIYTGPSWEAIIASGDGIPFENSQEVLGFDIVIPLEELSSVQVVKDIPFEELLAAVSAAALNVEWEGTLFPEVLLSGIVRVLQARLEDTDVIQAILYRIMNLDREADF